MTTMTAAEVREGDVVTYCGATFTVASVGRDETTGLMRFRVTGQVPQYIAPERVVEVVRPVPANPRPFVVLTRKYDADGNCRKGRRTFRTAAEQSRFLSTTDAAVTYYTH